KREARTPIPFAPSGGLLLVLERPVRIGATCAPSLVADGSRYASNYSFVDLPQYAFRREDANRGLSGAVLSEWGDLACLRLGLQHERGCLGRSHCIAGY